MKQPDLEYNNYFPYYTQKESGKKKSYYKIETIMHLSDNSGILISRHYRNGRIAEANMEMMNNRHNTNELRKEGKYISYPDFAEEVETAYRVLKVAFTKLLKEKAFSVEYYGTAYLKCRSSICFEFERERISVLFGKTEGVNSGKGYREIENSLFERELNESWDSFIEYFKSPKYIRKAAYEPNLKSIRI